jgi:Methyltransferase domain
LSATSSWTAIDELDSFDCTLANLSEVVLAALDAAGAESVAEIGAEHGLFTERLLEWAAGGADRRVTAIDPAPRGRLRALARERAELELIVETSAAALPRLELPDAVIIDGDHNYFTVSEELRMIGEHSPSGRLPLVLVHDVGWPLGRRDSYHDPDRVPAEHRQPLAEHAFLVPGESGVANRGLYYACTAAEEGGPGNGVLTAVEDFLEDRPELELAIVPLFFGLGVVWHRERPWAARVAEALAPWNRNPVLARVEEKRIEHLVAQFRSLQEIDAMRSDDYELQFLLSTMLQSKAFAVAERVSRLRQGGRPMFSREQVERALRRAQAEVDLLNGHDDPDRVNGLASTHLPPATGGSAAS